MNAPIHFTNSFTELSDFLKEKNFSGIFILTDENTRACCLPVLLNNNELLNHATVLEIPSGEAYKNLDTCQSLWKTLLQEHADRHSLLINLGGGVLSDLGGFVAGAYMRGISFVNIPTSLLAMTDATVGGKTGVDFCGNKNM